MFISEDRYQNNLDDFNEISEDLTKAASINISGGQNKKHQPEKIPSKLSLIFFITGFAYVGLAVINIIWVLLLSPFNFDEMTGNLVLECLIYLTLFVILGYILFKCRRYFISEISNPKNYLFGLICGVLIIAVEYGITSITNLFYEPELNANQDAINLLTKNYPTIMIFITVIIGPFCEELTYRVGLYNLLSKKNEILGYIISAFIFAFVHIRFEDTTFLAEITAFPVYLAISFLLNSTYKKYGLAGSYVAHAFINLVSIIMVLIA